MKITKAQLKQIIKEEISNALEEVYRRRRYEDPNLRRGSATRAAYAPDRPSKQETNYDQGWRDGIKDFNAGIKRSESALDDLKGAYGEGYKAALKYKETGQLEEITNGE